MSAFCWVGLVVDEEKLQGWKGMQEKKAIHLQRLRLECGVVDGRLLYPSWVP